MFRVWRYRYVWLSLVLIIVALTGIRAVALRSQPAVVGATATPGRLVQQRTPPTPTAEPATETPTPSATPTSPEAPAATPSSAPATPTAPPAATAASSVAPATAPSPGPPPAPTPDGQVRTAAVPILMYHYISDPPAGADAYRIDLSVSPREFEAQLAYLRAQGYRSITLEDLVRHLTRGTPLPPKPIILTFDDGYVDNYLYAFPLLRQYQFLGTFFVVVDFLVGGGPGYMSWEQVQTMQARGMDIEAHSYTHADLRTLGGDELVRQTAGARQALEAHLHKPVRFFCYPAGRYDQRTMAALRVAQYWGAVTTEAGVEHNTRGLFELSRVRIHGAQGIERFKALMEYYSR